MRNPHIEKTEREADLSGAGQRGVAGRWPAFSVASLLPALLLAIITFAVFHESLRADFVMWDDDINIYGNPHIQKLDGPHLRWMFTDCSYTPRYRPLNWLSWAMTYRLFGPEPLAFHLGDLLLHMANAVLVFWLIRMLLVRFPISGPRQKAWPVTLCAGIGALCWAIHPLRVEAVAWANCRIYTQSLCFLLLSLFCYLRSIESAVGVSPRRTFRYWLAVLFFALSLLTYPTGMPFVIVLLVLNIYPLGRLPASVARWSNDLGARRVLWEIIPFALVTFPSVAITLWARTHTTGIWEDAAAMKNFGWDARLSQAFYIWAYYLWRPWVPFHLSTTYTTLIGCQPMEPRFLLSAAMVILTTVGLFVIRHRKPMLLALWLCHLSWLIPMLGLTEPKHTSNDRYSYLPGILWSVLMAYGLLKLWKHPRVRIIALIVSLIVAAALGGLSFRQTKVWRNSEVLFRYIISELDNDPYRADLYWRLGRFYKEQEKLAEAEEQFETALRINPGFAQVQYDWGNTAAMQSKFDEAIAHYAEAVKRQPAYAEAHSSWGSALVLQGKLEEAQTHLLEALRLKPGYAEARYKLGNLLVLRRRVDEALPHYLEAVKLDPQNAEAQYYLAGALAQQGRMGEAVTHFQAALKNNPDYAAAANDLAWVLATATLRAVGPSGPEANEALGMTNDEFGMTNAEFTAPFDNRHSTFRIAEAVRLAERACELTTNKVAGYLDTLGVAYSEAGRFEEAVAATERAVACALTVGDKGMAARIEGRLAHYRQGRAYHLIPRGAGL